MQSGACVVVTCPAGGNRDHMPGGELGCPWRWGAGRQTGVGPLEAQTSTQENYWEQSCEFEVLYLVLGTQLLLVSIAEDT